MKITIDISSLTDKQYSGIPEYTLNLLKALFRIDKKNEYTLFYNSFSKKDISLDVSSAKVKVVNTKYPNKFFNLSQKLFQKPRLDNFFKTDLFFMPNAGFLSVPQKSKSLATVHDLSFLRYKEFFSLRRKFWHKAVNVKKFLNQFDHLIAVSRNTKKDLIELLKVEESRISVVHSGVEQFFSREDLLKDVKRIEAVKRKYNLKQPYILSLATLEPRKNIESIIEAYDIFMKNNQKFSHVNLVVAGARGWKSKKIFNSFKNSFFKDKISFIGYVDKEDKPILYALAAGLVFVSYYEGFGFPPLEAMQLKCPVVCSSNSSLSEIMGGGVFSVNPFKISEIAAGMEFFFMNEKFKNRQIKNAFNFSQKLTWEKTALKYLSVFEGLKNS